MAWREALSTRGPSVSGSLADNPKVKRFISKAEEDYRSAPKISATTQTGVPTDQENSNSPRRSMLQRIGQAAQNAGAAASLKAATDACAHCPVNAGATEASAKDTISERYWSSRLED
jgi:hypothetical protein